MTIILNCGVVWYDNNFEEYHISVTILCYENITVHPGENIKSWIGPLRIYSGMILSRGCVELISEYPDISNSH